MRYEEDQKITQLLQRALSPSEEPDFWLNQKIIHQMEEQRMAQEQQKEIVQKKEMRKRKRPLAALVAVCVLAFGSLGVYAAWKYLTPGEVAVHTGDEKLAEAFQGEDAVYINETQSYGGYDVTLLGLVSGKDLSQQAFFADGVYQADRTYFVTAITNSDGTPIPDPRDAFDEEGNVVREIDCPDFFVSPLIQGCNPARFNIFLMDGGASWFVEDGVMYRICQCNNVEIFADRTIYVAVIDGSDFYDSSAYVYNEADGTIARNENYAGLNALFVLPLDASKADPAAVDEVIREVEAFWGGGTESTDNGEAGEDAETEEAGEAAEDAETEGAGEAGEGAETEGAGETAETGETKEVFLESTAQ